MSLSPFKQKRQSVGVSRQYPILEVRGTFTSLSKEGNVQKVGVSSRLSTVEYSIVARFSCMHVTCLVYFWDKTKRPQVGVSSSYCTVAAEVPGLYVEEKSMHILGDGWMVAFAFRYSSSTAQ